MSAVLAGHGYWKYGQAKAQGGGGGGDGGGGEVEMIRRGAMKGNCN